MNRLADEAALRRTADLYAQGADRKDKQLWRSVLAEDCRIEGPGFVTEGLDATLQSIDALGQMFRSTFHKVHNQMVMIDGDRASGETYCTADHLLNDVDQLLRWTIRYVDEWRREGEDWRFTRRKLELLWEETVPVTVRQG
ncbi:nuclear transport factor 2 family protein [Sphingobium agri]|uniref:Nuclear transport factor 2 family protein n=1 Tax=Sphingobium agri TaxID=2933566 RepID=A0ABT0DZZ2_9SPHN|nr:nuclear transport factor 2 family protein [Sphingobium agri]MCK0532655.1 nuclear transport factor 2 family protein [Sphingobium agri]